MQQLFLACSEYALGSSPGHIIFREPWVVTNTILNRKKLFQD